MWEIRELTYFRWIVIHEFNSCFENHQYSKLWKHEWVVPAEMVVKPKELKDLRKISLTSEFSLIFEGIIKDWMMIDIGPKIDPAQHENQKNTSTKHLLVKLMDKILKLIDQHPNRSAVIATMLDWSSAFDRQYPTLAIKKFLEIPHRQRNASQIQWEILFHTQAARWRSPGNFDRVN